jgi:hypothetical protein
MNKHLDNWSIFTQLNAASRTAVQTRTRWTLVDFEEMALPFCSNLKYSLLRDTHHPQDWFLFNVLNRYINSLVSNSIQTTENKTLGLVAAE